jgi:menaquinone-dependent protoporphyrinogen oxidase
MSSAASPKVLLLYASKHGQTHKIAGRLADELAAQGADVTVKRVPDGLTLSPADFDGVVIAASVHAGHHQHELVHYALDHHTSLSDRPSAFLSVSLTAADDDEESDAETRRLIDEFLDETGWIPATTMPVAGALQYREYDFVTRLAMRLIARKYGASGDTSRDQEFTDWDALAAFAASFADSLARHHTTI